MQPYSRSLTLTAAMMIAAAVCLFAVAEPQQVEDRRTRLSRQAGLPVFQPISLSDPDGQELILEDLSARAAIHGMLSLTELEFRFRNPQPRRVEGRFTCTLPPNAAISRFAKEVNGQLMEGEVVERLRANQVYEQFLHQMRDPALLEQDQGNRFSARIFPIEANATVRILVSYSALLPMRAGVRTYKLPLRGISKMGHFSFRGFVSPLPGESSGDSPSSLQHSTADVYSLEQRDYTPARDIELVWRPSADAPASRVLTAGDFYLASFRPQVRNGSMVSASHNWLFYVDSSASSAEGAQHRIDALSTLLRSLPQSDRVQVNAFDHDIAVLGSGTAAEMSRSIRSLLEARRFLGGTDLAAALRHAAKSAQEEPGRTTVFVSDLVATLGATESNEIARAIASIPPRARVHALILGSREEASVAKSLAAGRGRVVRVPFSEMMEQGAREAATALQKPLGASFDVADAAAEWVFPAHVDDIQPGDEVIVLGKTRAGGEVSVRLSGGRAGASTTLPGGTFGPLLEREAYRAYLESLAEREANEATEGVRRALQTEQVRVSVEQRVVIPRTTMLVLETESDYQRFGLDRRALAAILTVDAGGISRIDRRGSEPRPLPAPVPMPKRVTPPTPRDGNAGEGRVGAASPPPPPSQAIALDAAQFVATEAKDVQALNAPTAVAERTTTVTAQTPGVAPAPGRLGGVIARPRPEPPRQVQKVEDAGWIHRRLPTRAEVEQLQKKLAANQSDRELYNQLSEALAALEEWKELRALAFAWQPYDPENPQVYEVLGNADEHLGNRSEAARAYGSIIEVAASKPELLQRAGLLLVRVGRASLAETPLRRALELRPDRVNSYRHLALMLWLDGRPEEAARVLESATRQKFPNWYGDAQRVVRDELGYVYRTILNKSSQRSAEITDRARELGIDLKRRDSLRVTLAWETDANDVDLHVVDPAGEECFYSHKNNRSGLGLYEDITQGLGPEVIRTSDFTRGTYHVGVRYFAAGPMGVSRGIVVIMRDRGNGRDPSVEVEPFRLVQGGGDVRYVAAVEVK
ncbi:MAG: VIT domain-containing protein [Thermoanaerobaculia bacterium]